MSDDATGYQGSHVRVGDRDGYVTETYQGAGRVSFSWGQPNVQWHRFADMRRYFLEGSPLPCVACRIEAEIGTKEVPHPVPARFHSCPPPPVVIVMPPAVAGPPP